MEAALRLAKSVTNPAIHTATLLAASYFELPVTTLYVSIYRTTHGSSLINICEVICIRGLAGFHSDRRRITTSMLEFGQTRPRTTCINSNQV